MIKNIYNKVFKYFIILFSLPLFCAEGIKFFVAHNHEHVDTSAVKKGLITFRNVYNAVDWWNNKSLFSKNTLSHDPIITIGRVIKNLNGVYRVYVVADGVNTTLNALETLVHSVDNIVDNVSVLTIAGVTAGSLLQLADKAKPTNQAICMIGAGMLATPALDTAIKNFLDSKPIESMYCLKLFMGGVVVGFAFTQGSSLVISLSKDAAQQALIEGFYAGVKFDDYLSQHFNNAQDWTVNKSCEALSTSADCAQNLLVAGFYAGVKLDAFLDNAQDQLIDKSLQIAIEAVRNTFIIAQKSNNQVAMSILGDVIKSAMP